MNKAELITEVANRMNMTKKDAEEAVNTVFDLIAETLAAKEKVVLSGFGTFEIKERQSRSGRNPQTGETILISGSQTPVFKASKQLKDHVNE